MADMHSDNRNVTSKERPGPPPDSLEARVQLAKDLLTVLNWHRREAAAIRPAESVTNEVWARKVGVGRGNNISQITGGASWPRDDVLKAWDRESHCDGLLIMRGEWLHYGQWPDPADLEKWDDKSHHDFLVGLRRSWFPAERSVLPWVVLGLVVCVAIVWLILGPHRSPAQVAATKPVRVTAPADHRTVCYAQIVSGKWSDLPTDDSLWLVVHPLNDPFSYPQPGPLDRAIGDARGDWNGEAFFGTGTGPGGGEGKDFELSIVAASIAADPKLRAHIASLKETPAAGLLALPNGAAIRDTVTVRRGRC
jgi:hypothetical protein